MHISSMIVKTKPGRAQAVLQRLRHFPELTTYGIHRHNNIIVVAETASVAQLELLVEEITRTLADVWAVIPTYLHFEDEVEMELRAVEQTLT